MKNAHLGSFLMAVCLWFGVVSSALAVVYVTYKTRTATQTLESLRHQASDLHVQSGRYLLERSSLAAYSRVEKIAVDKHGMIVPKTEQMVVIKQ